MSGWTNEAHIERLKVLWPEGYSAAQIAKMLRREFPDATYSRNAVIGKVYRLGLLGRGNPSTPRHHNVARRGAAALAKARAQTAAPKRIACASVGAQIPEKPMRVTSSYARPPTEALQPAPRAVAREEAWKPLDGSSPVIWTSRAWNACAWPVGPGQGADTHSCALATVADGASYCSVHTRLACQPPQAKKKASATDLARSLRRYL